MQTLWERVRGLEGQTLSTARGREFDITMVDDRHVRVAPHSTRKLRTIRRQEFEQAETLGLAPPGSATLPAVAESRNSLAREAGAAVMREGDVVALTRTAYVPQRGRPEALAMLAEDPPELIDTMLHNVLGEGDEARLQQKIAYDNIGGDGLEGLRAALRREAARLLERSNAVLRRHDRDRSPRAPGGPRTYAGIGIYYFEAPRESQPPRSLDEPTRKRLRKRRNKA
jgi:hypothetical protein